MEQLVVRKLKLTDDLAQVARLIYDTDAFIFPYLYKNDVTGAVPTLIKMVERDTIYNYRNITVAVLGKEVVGIIIAKETPIVMNEEEMKGCIVCNEEGGKRFKKTYDEYYKLFEDEPQGVYIANVCVDKRYRGRGIAKQMLAAFLKEEPQKTYHLETVKDNPSALKLYQGLGFEIVTEYLGFVDVPCYRMIRKGLI